MDNDIKKLRAGLYYYKRLIKVGTELTPKQQTRYEELSRLVNEYDHKNNKKFENEEEEINHAKEVIEKNREHARQRYIRIKNDPEYLEEHKRRAKERYQRKKELNKDVGSILNNE